ncbi:MAG: MFS transporter [Candidatus Asgardarchaeia archaeon]
MSVRLTNILEESELKGIHLLIFFVSFIVYAFTAMDVMLISVLLKPIATEFGLNNIELGILGSSGYLGMFIGALIFGNLSDKIGRKLSLAIAITIYSIFTALCGLLQIINLSL